MTIVKKFKNGKIKIQLDYMNDGTTAQEIESVYHDDMFMSDLYINQINGYSYVVDFNTNLVYEIGSYLCQNPLKQILDELLEKSKIYLYPLTKKQSKDLLEDLENGY
jgi:hypothetical protein